MENENKLKNRKIETFTGDMAKVLEGDNSGLIKKIIHEEEEHEIQVKELSPKSKKNRVFMFVSMLLIVLALGLLIFLTFFNRTINTVPVTPQFTSVIFADKTEFKPIDGLTKEKIGEIILNEINNTNVKVGGVEGIYLTENKKVIDFKRFLSLMKNNLTSSQTDSFSNNFFLGAFKSGVSSVSPNIGDPFILVGVSSFSNIFSVMRIWENKMLYDLYGFFGVDISSENSYLFTKNFEDDIVANKNARILYDNNGEIILMYVFIDDSSIIVTNSVFATNEAILRIYSSKIKK